MQTFDFDEAPIAEIAEIVTNAYNVPTEWTGIRVFDADALPVAGQKMDCSRVWVDNVVTDALLDGTCAVQIDWRSKNVQSQVADALCIAKAYCGDYIAILGGPHAQYGVDSREVIIEDAVILKVWKLG
jgi:hypothetical protein